MIKRAIINIFEQTWPMILIFCVVIVTLRITYLFVWKKKYSFYQEVLSLGFIIYVMSLFYVVTFQDVSWSTSNFVPFQEMFRYVIGSKLFYKNVVGNMLMFVPYGFFASYFLKVKKPYLILILSLFVSTSIEITQLIIGRVFDIDDIVLNIIGGLVGYFIYKVIQNIVKRLPSWLKKEGFYNILIVGIVILVILLLIL